MEQWEAQGFATVRSLRVQMPPLMRQLFEASRQRLTVVRAARGKYGKSSGVRFLGGLPITIGGAGVSFSRGAAKPLRRRPRNGHNRAADVLQLCAQSAWKNKSALGAFGRRLHARLDTAKAIRIVAHQLAQIVYQMLELPR